MAMLVRLKPFNKQRGHLLRIVNYRGIKFEAAKGWYKVDNATAAYLGQVHQNPYSEDSPMAFDVMTAEQAKSVEAAETKAKEEKAKASDPIDAAIDRTGMDEKSSALTTEDLGGAAEPPAEKKPARKPRRGRGSK